MIFKSLQFNNNTVLRWSLIIIKLLKKLLKKFVGDLHFLLSNFYNSL